MTTPPSENTGFTASRARLWDAPRCAASRWLPKTMTRPCAGCSLLPRQNGFTLIEILAVLLLLGILSAVVVVSLSGTRRRAQSEDVAQELAFFDRLTRQDARRSMRPSMVIFDLDRQEIQRVDAQTQEPRGQVLRLAGGSGSGALRIEQILWGAQHVSAGQVSLPYSDQGISPSYALLLSGPSTAGGGAAGGGQMWVCFAGMTGQSRILRDAGAVNSLFGAIRDAAP